MNPSRTTMFDRLVPEYQAIIEAIPEGLLNIEDVDAARTKTASLMEASAARATPVPSVTVFDESVPPTAGRPELRIRLYVPEGRPERSSALLFIHGGGFVMGEIEHFDAQCKEVADGAGCLVASIGYRLAPEHPYPAPLEDCYSGLVWLSINAARLGIDSRRIAIGGTSAGGGLAAGLALLARDRGGPIISFQFLEAPMLDHRGITPSSQYVTHPKIWNRTANELAWSAYLGEIGDGDVPVYASPSLATDLTGLPPAYISVSVLELFFDEAVNYAQALGNADVACELHVYPNGFHGSTRALPNAELSQRWRADTVQTLRSAGGTGTK